MSNDIYMRNMCRIAVDNNQREDISYVIFMDFLHQHKTPFERFAFFPQILGWPGKPDVKEGRRLIIPDLGVGNFTAPGVVPLFKLHFGVEAK
jgi:hypothetical protein